MRVVGAEQEELGAGLLDHPADGLLRVGREAQLAARVVGGAQRQVEMRLGLHEDLLHQVEAPQPAHDPERAELDAAAAQAREALEHAVEHERVQEDLGGVRDRHQVLGEQALAVDHELAVPRDAVVVEGAVHVAAVVADVQHERHARFLQARPEPVVGGVRGRHVARGSFDSWIARQPRRIASSASATSRAGSASGTTPTGSRRGSCAQNALMRRLSARAPP